MLRVDGAGRSSMTTLTPIGRAPRSTATSRIAAVFLVAASLFVGYAAVEWFARSFTALGEPVEQSDRLINFLQSTGKTFENHGAIFTYAPHADIRDIMVYFSDSDFGVEYDYFFHTNNLGLVQDADIEADRPSLLILGDSFTEGMGAEPWFRKLHAANGKSSYQLINGGLRGTGFAQWSLLERYLRSKTINIKKVVVPFISDDYIRALINANEDALHCLESGLPNECISGNVYRNFPLPPPDELPIWVERIRDARKRSLTVILQRAARMLPATHLVYLALKAKLSAAYQANELASQRAIADLIARYGAGNVAFLHLPQKDEHNRPNVLGLKARRAIAAYGGELWDGFKLCGLTPADYDAHDRHPNARGYDKIARCVDTVVGRMLPE